MIILAAPPTDTVVVAESIPLSPTQGELPADDGEPIETQHHANEFVN